jgi:hypothetical protein
MYNIPNSPVPKPTIVTQASARQVTPVTNDEPIRQDVKKSNDQIKAMLLGSAGVRFQRQYGDLAKQIKGLGDDDLYNPHLGVELEQKDYKNQVEFDAEQWRIAAESIGGMAVNNLRPAERAYVSQLEKGILFYFLQGL